MDEPYEFKYAYNHLIFESSKFSSVGDSVEDVQLFFGGFECQGIHQYSLERFIKTLKEILGADVSSVSENVTSTSHFSNLVATFICRVFPPHSPFVIYNEVHESSRLRPLLHDATSLDDPKFMMNVLNLYWRNNKSICGRLVSSIQSRNQHYLREVAELVNPLLEVICFKLQPLTLQNIQQEYEYIHFIISGIKQGRKVDTVRTFESKGVITCRSDLPDNFDRNSLFVSADTVLLDLLAHLETLFQFVSEEEYDYVLSATVSTAEGECQLSSVLTNMYYLMAQAHQHMQSKQIPLYKMQVDWPFFRGIEIAVVFG
ncbi:uncharacterized protein BXIN_1489 [Babesia sp. Xinjiang]|uniref:uncharacterized protein n=1 Tax=Babesia sp. Xinjiang TaxID=462227 RepID=UPI000A23E9D8|nr:uncharacterized protein BXIN_1489 [Babesia sp. Xinjiang]ORM42264.1 hypothetical protein BXIN_1489 [Babesia sp. Xinjiang]